MLTLQLENANLLEKVKALKEDQTLKNNEVQSLVNDIQMYKQTMAALEDSKSII